MTNTRYVISLVLNAHLPFVRDYTDSARRSQFFADEDGEEADIKSVDVKSADVNSVETLECACEAEQDKDFLVPSSKEETWFFEAVSETYLPLLAVFDRLEGAHIPFRLGLSLSPVLGQMFCDDYLIKKYVAHLEHQIEFGRHEVERLEGREECALAQYYFNQAVERHAAFTIRYDRDILKALDHYWKKGRIELIAAPATNAFLPFLCRFPEAVRAQMETALSFYRHTLGISPRGFWPGELGWTKDLSSYIYSYGLNYTIVNSHGLLFGKPPPSRGTFYPVKTEDGLFVLACDYNASTLIDGMRKKGLYRDNSRDAADEQENNPFVAKNGENYHSGYKYRQAGNDGLYDPAAAKSCAQEQARELLENISGRLAAASAYMKETPISLCAFNADSFGRQWHGGAHFIESLFRQAAGYRELQFMTPSEYLFQQPITAIEASHPEFSSWGDNGYAELWLDSSNDWIYRHINRSIDRMVELADRFTEDSSLKERALNQAAREILLAQASEWPALLYREGSAEYAKKQIESALQNFNTIYESLGRSHISTEWLTSLERRHQIFPNINYRVFRSRH
jgi:1,4-alpha-glucan branching enzyme